MQGSMAPSAGLSQAAGAERRTAAPDVRDALFGAVAGRRYGFEMTACRGGVLAGSSRLREAAARLGVEVETLASDGDRLATGSLILAARGDAWQVARAEEQLVGLVAKASGVATAAAELVAQAAGRARVVCGAWKKVAPECRADLRAAIATGGAGLRILDRPFVYLDKNYVRMLGGVVTRIPVFDHADVPLAVVHQSLLYKFLADRSIDAMKAGQPFDADAYTLADLLAAAGMKELVQDSLAYVSEAAMLSDAKDQMDRVPSCQDVFVTKSGRPGEAALGWLTDAEVRRAAKV